MLLDNHGKLIETITLQTGSTDNGFIDPRKLIEEIVKESRRTKRLVLVHSHPGENPAPSEQDISAVAQVSDVCRMTDTVLDDLAIITQTSYYSFRRSGDLC